MRVDGRVVPKPLVKNLWPVLREGVAVYRSKTPHAIGTEAEVLEALSHPEGDDLFMFSVNDEYAGFMTFKAQDLEGERWGTIAMIYVEPRFQQGEVLPRAAQLLEKVLRRQGCNIMNYMTARKGFQRLAPRLGFRPRIIEWMKEI